MKICFKFSRIHDKSFHDFQSGQIYAECFEEALKIAVADAFDRHDLQVSFSRSRYIPVYKYISLTETVLYGLITEIDVSVPDRRVLYHDFRFGFIN